MFIDLSTINLTSAQTAAMALKQNNVTVITVGIGPGVNLGSLGSLSSGSGYNLSVSSVANINNTLMQPLIKAMCAG